MDCKRIGNEIDAVKLPILYKSSRAVKFPKGNETMGPSRV